MPSILRPVSPHAARLRRNMTDVERGLWQQVRNRGLAGFKFRRQAPLGPYVVDFLCIERRLIVELDGGQHNDARDAARTAWLTAQGYRMLRVWNHEMVENPHGVLEHILHILREPAAGEEPSPNPLPRKAGEGT